MGKGACLELRDEIGNIDYHYLVICAWRTRKTERNTWLQFMVLKIFKVFFLLSVVLNTVIIV